MATTLNKPEELLPLVEEWVEGLGGSGLYETVFEEMLPLLQDDHGGYFDAQASPAGEAWVKLAPSTIAAKGHDRILQRSGVLMESLRGLNGDSIRDFGSRNDESAFLVFGTSTEYGHFHRDGTKKMPARPFVGMTEERQKWLDERVLDGMVQQWAN